MAYPCEGCRWAEWSRTAAGRLHPSGDGRCTWQAEFKIAGSCAVRAYDTFGKPVTVRGGLIRRKSGEEWPLACDVREGLPREA